MGAESVAPAAISARRLPDGSVFNRANAVLLMASGTYEAIAAFLRERPEIERSVRESGQVLWHAGITPDMKMLQKLREIYARFQSGDASGSSAAIPSA